MNGNNVRGLALLLATTMLTVPGTMMLTVLPAQAQSAADTVHLFNIQAKPIRQSLNEIARVANISVIFNETAAASVSGNAIQGSMTVSQAINQVLAGSQLSWRFTNNSTVTIAAQNAGNSTVVSGNSTILDTINVNGQSGSTEGTGLYTTSQMATAVPLGLSIRETPQSVSVVTRQRMEDQGLKTFSDVVNYTPGMNLTKWGGERPRIASRGGFSLENLQIDGAPIQYEESSLSPGALDQYDRVEIVRGANGLMEGAGTPAGSINLVRKRPTDVVQRSITASAGSLDNYGTSVDLSGPLNAEGTIRGRTVLSYQDKNSFIDDYGNKRGLLYGVLEFDLTEDTTVTVGASYSNEDNPGVDWNGLGTNPDGSFLSISRSDRLSPSFSYWDKTSKTEFVELEHRFDDAWTLSLNATAIQSKMQMVGTYLGLPTLDVNGDTQFTMYGAAYDYDRDQISLNARITGEYDLFGRSHDVAFGTTHRTSTWFGTGGPITINGSSSYTFNPLNWDPTDPQITSYSNPWKRDDKVEQTGVYAATRLSITEPFHVIAGGRLDWYKFTGLQAWNGIAFSDSSYEAKGEFTPYLGVTYDFDDNHTAFASWTRIFNPQENYSASGAILPPAEGSNYELGVKGEYFDGRLNASLSIFQIDLTNLPETLPVIDCQTGLTACYAPAGKVRSRGVDFEVSGEVLPDWQVMAGYTFSKAEYVEDSTAGSVGDLYKSEFPQHMLKLYTTYRLGGALEKLTVGGGLRYMGETYVNISGGQIRQGGYTVVDLSAKYEITNALDVTFNVNNVFDKEYYQSLLSASGGNTVGDPRNYLLTAKLKF